MREIKFRGFDRKTNHMFPIHELIFDRTRDELHTFYGYDDWDKDGYTRNGGSPNKLTGNSDGITFKRFEIMQYTGLKDYAGKEIYEGDIVEEVVSNNPRIFEVKWDEYGMFLFVPRSLNDSTNAIDYYELQDEVGEIIVIGNIYEHPHLLEGDSHENQ